jgi:hypothetical protein
MSKNLERYQKSRNHAVNPRAAVLLGFGFVFAQSQALYGHAPSLSLAQTPKSLAAARLQYFLKSSAPTEALQHF